MAKEHFHTHRALIGFDEHGIPTVIAPAHNHKTDGDGRLAPTEAEFTSDYRQAVAAYRKTFPSRQEVQEETPDPAVRDLLSYAGEKGIETPFDRFDLQKPHCTFGLAGTCCKVCNMGPCRITEKSPRGVCGADADLIVARNLLRSAAAGVAQHGIHAREVILSLKWAAQRKLDFPLIGKQKIRDTAAAFGIKTYRRPTRKIAEELADILLQDLSRTEPEEYQTISACAPPERQRVWKDLDILPVSAYHEIAEAYHRTGCGVDGDWRNVMQQFLRCGLAFTFSTVLASGIATDCLFGVGDRVTSMTNVGALKDGYVNIAVHGHLPTLVSAIVAAGQSEEYQAKAREAGARGIRFYGICCSGLAAMYRYGGVIPLSNAVTAEFVLATGALDLWVADVQDVFPAIMDVADCFRTRVVTTSDSARLPGAEHIAYDHHHSNIGETKAIAGEIVDRAIESFRNRKNVPRHIPEQEIEAEVGFSVEYIHRRFGSMRPLAQALKDGRILGIVNMVGCSNTKVPYERDIVEVAETLLKHNVLILTNGCASYPLMKLGYCRKDARKLAGSTLSEFLKPDLPPVWHVGECIDNARSSGIFAGIAGELGTPLRDLPFAFSSPEWGNEKGIDAALGFRLMGISSYHCVEAQIHGSANVIHFLKEETKETLGSSMIVNVDPVALGEQIVSDMLEKRRRLGWSTAETPE